ncbi:MAG: hypothetical protein J6B53_02140 [Clostridia bacterium]|nr:hypothetical protein [Clostridia bacterium]
MLGGMVDVVIEKDGEGHARVTSADIIPLVTHTDKDYSRFEVYPLSEYTDALAAENKIAGIISRKLNRKVNTEYLWELYEIVDEGSIGTLVYLTESDYISLMIPKGKMSGTAAVHDYIGDFGEITELSETMNVFAVHGDENHRMPYLDVVEIGVNLPDGTGLIVCAYCPYGHTEVYELLLTVLGSITDTAVLEDWLNGVGIPTVTKQ